MSILKSEMTKLTFKPAQLKKLIAADLDKNESDIEIRYVVQNTADDRFSSYPSYELTEVEVTIKA